MESTLTSCLSFDLPTRMHICAHIHTNKCNKSLTETTKGFQSYLGSVDKHLQGSLVSTGLIGGFKEEGYGVL